MSELERDLYEATKYAETQKDFELLNRALEVVRAYNVARKNCDAAIAERDRWRDIANRLGTHMGEALYGDEEWSCREYAISAYTEWERTEGAHLTKYEVDPQPVWYFKEGKET